MSRIPCGECDKVFRTETGQQWHLEHRHGRTVPQVPPLELPPEAATGEPWGERCGVLGCEHQALATYVGKPSVVKCCECGTVQVIPARVRAKAA